LQYGKSTYTLLGDDRFQALDLAYIDAEPSHHFPIRWFGHRLSRFLADAADYQDTPVLAEMAAFEWALRDAFDVADARVLGLDELRRIAPEARALDAAANGAKFDAICAGIIEWVDEFNAPQRVAGTVSRWAEEGLIASVVTVS